MNKNRQKKVISEGERETLALGRELGRACRGGESFFLSGDLGSGKTKFVQGLASGLGIKDRVNSPTFNILKIYKLRRPSAKLKYFCHVDAYRLNSADELLALGIDEFLGSLETVTAIEWGDKVKKIRPLSARIVKLKILSPKQREIIIS